MLKHWIILDVFCSNEKSSPKYISISYYRTDRFLIEPYCKMYINNCVTSSPNLE